MGSLDDGRSPARSAARRTSEHDVPAPVKPSPSRRPQTRSGRHGDERTERPGAAGNAADSVPVAPQAGNSRRPRKAADRVIDRVIDEDVHFPASAPHAGKTDHGTTPNTSSPEGENHMSDHSTALKGAMEIEGALGCALVDSNSGMALGTAGSPMDLDLDVAAAGNSSVVQAKMRTMAELGLQQSIEDILITLDKQYHIIRPLAREEGFFLYLVLDRARANLAMARFRLARLEKDLKI